MATAFDKSRFETIKERCEGLSSLFSDSRNSLTVVTAQLRKEQELINSAAEALKERTINLTSEINELKMVHDSATAKLEELKVDMETAAKQSQINREKAIEVGLKDPSPKGVNEALRQAGEEAATLLIQKLGELSMKLKEEGKNAILTQPREGRDPTAIVHDLAEKLYQESNNAKSRVNDIHKNAKERIMKSMKSFETSLETAIGHTMSQIQKEAIMSHCRFLVEDGICIREAAISQLSRYGDKIYKEIDNIAREAVKNIDEELNTKKIQRELGEIANKIKNSLLEIDKKIMALDVKTTDSMIFNPTIHQTGSILEIIDDSITATLNSTAKGIADTRTTDNQA